jgi:hypothetical protein
LPKKSVEPEVKILNTDGSKPATTVVKIPKKKVKTPSGSQVSDSVDVCSSPAKELPVIGMSVHGFDIRKSGSDIAPVSKGRAQSLNVAIPVTSTSSPHHSPHKANPRPKPTSPKSPTAKAVPASGTASAATSKTNSGGASQQVSAVGQGSSDVVTTSAPSQQSPDTLIVSGLITACPAWSWDKHAHTRCSFLL